jgi:hypothetical protein
VVAATGGHPAGDKAQRQCVQHWGCMGSAPVRRGGGVLTEMANRHEGAEAIAVLPLINVDFMRQMSSKCIK